MPIDFQPQLGGGESFTKPFLVYRLTPRQHVQLQSKVNEAGGREETFSDTRPLANTAGV